MKYEVRNMKSGLRAPVAALVVLMFLTVGQVWAKDYTQDPNCVGAWMMDSTRTSPERDWSGHGNTLYPNGTGALGAQFGVERVQLHPPGYSDSSRCRMFDSTTTTAYFTELADGSELDINGANATISISFWVYPRRVPVTNDFSAIASKYDHSGNQRGPWAGITGTDAGSHFRFRWTLSSNGTAVTHCYSDTLTPGKWYHVVCVSNDAYMKIWVNGVVDADSVAYTAGIFNNSAKFQVGNYNTFNGGVAYNFDGAIEELAVFNDALTPSEIADIYGNGLTGAKGLTTWPIFTSYGVNPASTFPPTYATWVADLEDSLAALVASSSRWSVVTSDDTTAHGRRLNWATYTPPAYSKTFMFSNCTHGDESSNAVGAMAFCRYITANPTALPYIRFIWSVPINPDGTTAGTRKNADYGGVSDTSVNLNRNFPIGWSSGLANTHKDYGGHVAASERETQIFMDHFPTLGTVDAYVDIHGYLDSGVKYPWMSDDDVTFANTTLLANGFSPFGVLSSSESGMVAAWVHETVDQVYLYEADSSFTASYGSTGALHAEEQNRLVCWLIEAARRLDAPAVGETGGRQRFGRTGSRVVFGRQGFGR